MRMSHVINDAHRALRDGTAAAHERVDAVFSRFDLSDRSGYAAFLGAHADATLPFEAALDAADAGRVVPDWRDRRRGDLLRADLADLGMAEPDAPSPRLAGDVAAAAGAIYVLEGSRMGARLLARRVGPGLPARFLNARQSPETWRKLLSCLDFLLDDPASIQIAVDSATDCFAAFERSGRKWLKD